MCSKYILFVISFLISCLGLSQQSPQFNSFGPYCVNDTPDSLPIISNNSLNGLWQPNTINTATPNSTIYTFIPEDSTVNPISVAILVNPLPTVAAITGSPDVCVGSTTVLASSTTGGVWSTSDATVADVSASGVVTGASAGSATITYTITDGNGCTNSTSTSVTVNATPTATVTASGATTFCAGGTVDLTANAGTSYLWSNGAQTQTITVTTSGSYSVTVTNGSGCSTTSSAQSVTVNPLPTVAAITGSPDVCVGSTTVLASSTTGGVWSTSDATVADVSASGVVTGASAGSATITYTVTDGNGCTNSTSASVTVNATPTATVTASGATTFCAGGTVDLTANAGTSYLWSNGAQTQTITVTTSGSYSVTVTNGSGCSTTSSAEAVTVNQLPNVNAGNDVSICYGDFAAVNATGAATYVWSDGLVNGSPVIFNETKELVVIGTDTLGCEALDTMIITVHLLPDVIAGNDTSICQGEPITLTGSGANVYQWTGNVVNGQPFFPFNTNAYQVLGIDTNGCISSSQITITVLSVPLINAGQDVTINCIIDSVEIGIVTQTNDTYYSWLPTIGLSDSDSSITMASPPSNQVYEITATDLNGCISTDEVTIFIDTVKPISFAGINTTISCNLNSNGVQLGTLSSNNLSYNWTPSNGLNNSSIANPLAIPTQTTEYHLEVTNPINGCSSVDSVNIIVDNQSPVVNAGQDTIVCEGSSIQLNGSISMNSTNINWSPTSTISAPSSLSPFSYPAFTTTYTLTATGLNGCQSSDDVTIVVNDIPLLNLGEDQSICTSDSLEFYISSEMNNLNWTGIADQLSGDSITIYPTYSGYVIAMLSDSVGCHSKDSIFVNVLSPNNYSISGDTIVCENEIWSKYLVNPSSNNLLWTIENGDILGSSSPFDILVHWGYGSEGKVQYNAIDNMTGCPIANQQTVSYQGEAPDTSIIQRVANTNILYIDSAFQYIRWGYTNFLTDISASTCTNIQYCDFSNFELTTYTYWVEAGEDIECLTKSYFNRPNYFLNINDVQNSYQIFPNPTTGIFNIKSSNSKFNKILSIKNALGKIVMTETMTSNNHSINISQLSDGIYYLYFPDDFKTYKLIKK